MGEKRLTWQEMVLDVYTVIGKDSKLFVKNELLTFMIVLSFLVLPYFGALRVAWCKI
jgi:hypothetical protein